MSNRTPEVKHTRGWVKYLAVSATALLLAACSSGLNADVPTQDELAPQASSCLNRRGYRVKVTNNRSIRVFNKRSVIIDARGKTVSDKRIPLVANYIGGSLCISGGTYVTGARLSSSWHYTHPFTGLFFQGRPGKGAAKITIENVAVGVGGRIVGDAFTFKQYTNGWVVKGSYVGRAGDDSFESDRFSNGTFDDNLVDSAFTGMSVRREKRSYAPARYYTVNVKNSLISIKNGNDLIKVTVKGKNYARLSLKNNIFYIPKRDGGKIERKVLNGGSCSNNTIVYTGGSKSYLNYLKRNSSKCFKVTTDKRVWDRARANWFKRHPQFSRYR